MTLLAVGAWATEATAAGPRPKLCWRHVEQLPAGRARLQRPPDPRADRILVTDGAHPVVSLGLPPAGSSSRSGRRSHLVVRGDDPQLFVQWPRGGLIWIWARAPLSGIRRLTVGVETRSPSACISRGDGGAALVVEAVGENGERTCLSWAVAAAPELRPGGNSAACVPVDVPQLVGRPIAQARSILEDLELAVGDLEGRPAGQPVNLVLSQDPASGSGIALATGDSIDLTIVSEQLVGMPPIVGYSVAEARSILDPVGLELAVNSGGIQVDLDRVHDYEVEKQRPEAGAMQAVGSRVSADVAWRLPELSGMPVVEALRQLAQSGLRARPSGFGLLAPEVAAAYEVAIHRPGAGELVAYGQQVEIDAWTAVPNLRGLTPAQAQRRLGGRGLQLQRSTEAPAEIASERIRNQSPRAGGLLAPGSVVAVTVGVLTPDIEGASAAQATRRLSARGLKLALSGPGAAVGRRPGTSAGYRLVAQRPRPRALAAAGATVTAELEIQVPNLLWHDAAEAQARLAELGLGSARPQPWAVGSLRQHVAAQAPIPGTWLAAGTPVQLFLGPGVAPPTPDPRWPWLWMALVAVLGSLLLTRPRKLPRKLRIQGHTDFGKQTVETAAGATSPPAVRLRPHWDPGSQTIDLEDG